MDKSPDTTARDAVKEPEWQRRHYWVQVAGVIIAVLIATIYGFQLNEMRKSTNAAKKAADAAQAGLELSKKTFELSAKNIELTQKGTELGQRTIELTQKSLETTQEALKHASKANEISEKSMEAANTPWIDVTITGVVYKRSNRLDPAGDLPPAYGVLGATDSKGRVSNNTVDVTYAVQNHSDSPSPRIYAECFLKDVKGCVDREISAFNHRAIMPRQKMEGHASLLVTSGADPKRIVDDINRAKIGIRIYVLSFDAIGKKSSFIETFYKINGKFTVTNTEFNPADSEIDKMLDEALDVDSKRH